MEQRAPQPYDVPPAAMQRVIDLASKIAQSDQGFQVQPPREVTADPSVLMSEDIDRRLSGTTWAVRLPDGQLEVLLLTEFALMLYNLFALREQIDQARRRGSVPKDGLEFTLTLDMARIMAPESLRSLLGKLKLEPPPPRQA